MKQKKSKPIEKLPQKELMRIDEAAAHLDVEESTIRLWIDHGVLKSEKVGGVVKVTKESVYDFRIADRVKGT